MAMPKTSARKYPESRALASSVPALPVAVSAAQAAMDRQRRVPTRMTGKAKEALPHRLRADAIPSVEALRSRWLAAS